MFYYAELNEQNVAVGVKMVGAELNFSNHISIESLDEDYLFRKYENGKWSEEKYLPEAGAIQLTEFEKLRQENELLKKSQLEQDTLLMEIMMGGM